MFPTSRVGPSSSVDRNRGAERKADHPRRGFQFPELRLKSTRRLDDRRPQARNCKFFFSSRAVTIPQPLMVVLTLTDTRTGTRNDSLKLPDETGITRPTRGSGFSFFSMT